MLVKDPLNGSIHERQFQVSEASAEFRQAVRDERLQTALSDQTGGLALTLENAVDLAKHVQLEPRREVDIRSYALWESPFWFTLIVTLLLAEWAVRKWRHLS